MEIELTMVPTIPCKCVLEFALYSFYIKSIAILEILTRGTNDIVELFDLTHLLFNNTKRKMTIVRDHRQVAKKNLMKPFKMAFF